MSCCPRPDHTPLRDDEMPSEEDLARFARDEIECPKCGADVWHDASQCFRCGHVFMDEWVKKSPRGWMVWAAVLVVLGMVLGVAGWMF